MNALKYILVPLAIVSNASTLNPTINSNANSKYSIVFSYDNNSSTDNFLSSSDTIIKGRGYNTGIFDYEHIIGIISNLMDNYDDNEDEIIEILEKENNDNFKILFKYAFSFCDDVKKSYLLSCVLKSNIKIINDWYKDALVNSRNSKNKFLSIKAKRIYELYSEEFSRV